jgi:hypothetical protein
MVTLYFALCGGIGLYTLWNKSGRAEDPILMLLLFGIEPRFLRNPTRDPIFIIVEVRWFIYSHSLQLRIQRGNWRNFIVIYMKL